MLSGGEKQKVDILVQLAIRKMLSRYLDFSSNILVLDEIFDNLDPAGTRGVLQLIAQRLTDIESIFIISHHAAELNINYDT
jgi:DNA repair exonuclease SbcCD ATPase subunit